MKNKSRNRTLDDEAAELVVAPPMPMPHKPSAMGMQGKPMSMTSTKDAFHPNPFGRKPK